MRRLYEGIGSTLDEALAALPGRKSLKALESPRIEMRILDEDTLITSYEGNNFRRVQSIARANAQANTRGAYNPKNSVYRTEILIRGYY